MGWISNRHMQSGGSINRNPAKQRKGPLRKIVATISYSTGIFDPALVELECGHRVRSHGQFRARCDKCAAPAIEARSDATTKIGAAEGESAGPQDDAQSPPQ